MKEIKVIGWTKPNNRRYPELQEVTRAVVNAIVENIRENGYEFDGESHQCDDMPCTPVLNTGHRVCLSPRTWGGVMAQAYNVDNWDGNAYMRYYMAAPRYNYPKSFVDDSLIVGEDADTEQEEETEYKEESPAFDREFEIRRTVLQMFEAELFMTPSSKQYKLLKQVNNNSALLTSMLAGKGRNSQACVDLCLEIMKCWICEDGAEMRDGRLTHLEQKFVEPRSRGDLKKNCPEQYLTSYANLDDDLFPCLYFLLCKCPESPAIQDNVREYCQKLFEYSRLYCIDMNENVSEALIKKGIALLKKM